MPRIARYIFNGFTLLLCLSAACLWPRTRLARNSLAYITTSGNGFIVETVPAGIAFRRRTHYLQLVDRHPDEIRPLIGWSLKSAPWGATYKLNIPNLPPVTPSAPSADPLGIGTAVDYAHLQISRPPPGRLGFSWNHAKSAWGPPFCSTNFDTDHSELTLPLWFVMILLASPTLFTLFRRISRCHKQKPGLCRACGYDLRATPERCPECGTIPSKTTASLT